MKINTSNHSLVYDLVNHMRSKGMPDEMAGHLRFLLEDNLLMNIKVDGKLYEVPWRYWQAYTSTFSACCGCCCDESILDVDIAKKELLKHATQLTDHALDY